MKTLRVCLALLLLPVLGVVAQDAPEKDATAIPAVELYKTKGRAWNYRVTSWERGNAPRVTNWTHKVTAVNEEAATVEWTSRAPGSSGSGVSKQRFETAAEASRHWADPALPTETLDLGFAKFECNKHVAKEEGIETTTWVSREYHPLIVKQVKLGKDSCEVRRLTSFDNGEIDPWNLYRIEGRSWTMRNTLALQGMDPNVSHTRQTVVSVDDEGASLKSEMLDKDRKLMGGAPATEFRIEFETPDSGEAPQSGMNIVITREVCEVALGEFDCTKIENDVGTSWVSVQWPGLVVKTKMESFSSELVEFDLGHDAMRFYRTAGNSYVLRSTTSFGGMDMESEMRMEVKSINDGKAKYVIVSMDQDGNEQMRNEQTMDVPVKEGAAMSYDEQIEETVTVPAGTFRCIKTEVEGSGMTMWMHHGVIVKSTMSTDEVKMTQELVELKME